MIWKQEYPTSKRAEVLTYTGHDDQAGLAWAQPTLPLVYKENK